MLEQRGALFEGCARYGCLYHVNVKPLEIANQALATERDDLRAKLQASEEKIKRYETPEYHVRHNCCTAVEASERALERVRAWASGEPRMTGVEGYGYSAAMRHVRAALASPGSPQEKWN